MSEKAIAKGYYAVFEYSSGAVEVEFPLKEIILNKVPAQVQSIKA